MAESIVEKMFGLNTEQIESARRAELDNEAVRFAKMDPFERATAGIYSAAGGLARAGMGMLGMQDPAVAAAQQTQEIQKRIDHSTPEGLMEGARIFNQSGNPKLAFMYQQAATAKQQEKATIAKTQAEEQNALAQAARARREEDMSKYSRLQKIEPGVEGNYDLRQQALYDPMTGEIRFVGAPYRGAAAIAAQSRAEQAEKRLQAGQEKEHSGKQGVSTLAEMLRGYYTQLDKMGSIVSTKRAGAENARARAMLTPAGQAAAGAVGTETQRYLNQISATKPLLLLAIKNATGLSATQMNSNAELQFYLKAATDPALGYEANIEALQNLDRLFGIGAAKEAAPGGLAEAAKAELARRNGK